MKNKNEMLVLINSDKTPRLVPPLGGFKGVIKTRLAEIQKHTPKLHPLFFRVYAGQTGLIEAVKAKCLNCCCLQIDKVRNCRVFACPIWDFRPFQQKNGKDNVEVKQ
jgi:hypothetical protein